MKTKTLFGLKSLDSDSEKHVKLIMKYKDVLFRLARNKYRDLGSAIKNITEVAGKTMGVERVSVWFFNEDKTAIICRNLYELSKNRHSNTTVLTAKVYPRYFKALEMSRVIAADDACRDSRTSEFAKTYLKPNRISSMMDVPFCIHGKVAGIICYENVGDIRRWSLDDQSFVGSLADMLSVALEASERQKMEDALRKSEELYRKLAESSKDFIFIVDDKGVVKYVNSFSANMFKIVPEKICGKNINQLFPPGTYKRQLKNIRSVFVTGKPVYVEHYTQFPTGGMYLDTWLIPLRDECRKVYSVLGISRDLTERKNTELEMERLIGDLGYAKKQLEGFNKELEKKVLHRTRELEVTQDKLIRAERLTVLGKLAGSLSHELRNPLGVMKNAVYYLTQKGRKISKKDYFDYLNILRKQIDNASRIMSETLDFARPREMHVEKCNIKLVIEDVLKHLVIPKCIRIKRKYTDGSGLVLDKGQMVQVFNNIITNSIQAIKGSGEITISAFEECKNVIVVVADTGIGISREDLKKVFEPLFSRKARGIGLGLSIVKNIIENHKGKISIKSKLGTGTEVTVKIPLVLE
jgi:PAS domain S-box-containing protein